ncbi:hypothetical protein D3C76_1181940 [compost metagenome]
MCCALDRFDEQALVALLVDSANVAAVDLQVRQPQVSQVADHAEASAKALQAQAETKRTQAPGQLLQHGLIGQLLFAEFQRQARPQCRMLAEQLINPLQCTRIGQGGCRQVQGQ